MSERFKKVLIRKPLRDQYDPLEAFVFNEVIEWITEISNES